MQLRKPPLVNTMIGWAMTTKSALEIIQESLSPEDAAKFHSGSRKPFDYEQPVIDVAKGAMNGRTFKTIPTAPLVNDVDKVGPALDDVDYFYPDSQLVLYYTKMVAGLEARLVIAKQKLEAAEKRQKVKE